MKKYHFDKREPFPLSWQDAALVVWTNEQMTKKERCQKLSSMFSCIGDKYVAQMIGVHLTTFDQNKNRRFKNNKTIIE